MSIATQKVEVRMSRSVRTPSGGPVPECPSVQSLMVKRDEQTVRCVLRSCQIRQDVTRSLLLFCSLVNTLVLLPKRTIKLGTQKTLFRCQSTTRRSIAYVSIYKYS